MRTPRSETRRREKPMMTIRPNELIIEARLRYSKGRTNVDVVKDAERRRRRKESFPRENAFYPSRFVYYSCMRAKRASRRGNIVVRDI